MGVLAVRVDHEDGVRRGRPPAQSRDPRAEGVALAAAAVVEAQNVRADRGGERGELAPGGGGHAVVDQEERVDLPGHALHQLPVRRGVVTGDEARHARARGGAQAIRGWRSIVSTRRPSHATASPISTPSAAPATTSAKKWTPR